MTFDQVSHLSSLLASFKRDAWTRAEKALMEKDYDGHARLFDAVLLVDALAPLVRDFRATLENHDDDSANAA